MSLRSIDTAVASPGFLGELYTRKKSSGVNVNTKDATTGKKTPEGAGTHTTGALVCDL
jgi:hypothetical protein